MSFPPRHPLLDQLTGRLEKKEGRLVFLEPLHDLHPHVDGIADAEQRFTAADALVTFAWFLEVRQGSPDAAKKVMALAIRLLPALESAVRDAHGRADPDRARKFIEKERATRRSTGPIPPIPGGTGVGLRTKQ